jgi:hypothetical protein
MANFLKSVEGFTKNKNFILLFLLVLVGFVLVDCNTKMFSKLVEGNGCGASANNNNTDNNNSAGVGVNTCGRGTGQPASNPTNSAKRDCNVSGVNAMGGTAGSQPQGNVEGESLYVSATGPYGRDVPKTLQGDYSTLKSFGLTNLKDVVNYIPGDGPAQFSRGNMNNNNAAGRRNTNINNNSNTNVNKNNSNNNNSNNNSCKPIVYGADWCGWTKKQKKYMEDKGIDYTYVDCAKDKDACPPEVKGYPAIKHCDGTLKPGYQEI